MEVSLFENTPVILLRVNEPFDADSLLFLNQFEGFALHGVEVLRGSGLVVAAALGFVEQYFQPAIKMLVKRERLASFNTFEQRRLRLKQCCNERIRVCVAAGVHLFAYEAL